MIGSSKDTFLHRLRGVGNSKARVVEHLGFLLFSIQFVFGLHQRSATFHSLALLYSPTRISAMALIGSFGFRLSYQRIVT